MKPAAYYQLTKPGIIRGNLLTATAGFFVASGHHPNLSLLAWTLIGISGVIASACVINNYIDRDIDKAMARTKKRALATGEISVVGALIYAACLAVIGYGALAFKVNALTTLIGVVGMLAYVALYGYYKRHSVHGTLVGTISGAVPPVAGYTAVSGRLDSTAALLFLVLVAWQMAHFYAIAIYRLGDYHAAGIPVMPAVHGVARTKRQILAYCAMFTLTAGLVGLSSHVSLAYVMVAVASGLSWLGFGLKTYRRSSNTMWAKQMFLYSLLVITIWSLSLSIDSLL
jgi:protoheme IX farnesyltransferase